MLVQGLSENTLENTEDLVITMFKYETDIKFFLDDFDRSHRIGKKNNEPNKIISVIVKFMRYKDRDKIFRNKKWLKGKKMSVTESLTGLRMRSL